MMYVVDAGELLQKEIHHILATVPTENRCMSVTAVPPDLRKQQFVTILNLSLIRFQSQNRFCGAT